MTQVNYTNPVPGTGVVPMDTTTGTKGEVQSAQLALPDGTNTNPVSAANPLPVKSADGGQVTVGTTTDAAWSGTGGGSLIAIAKAIWARLRGGQATSANSLPVVLASDQPNINVAIAADTPTLPVSGTFWQATQPTSNAAGAQADGHSASIGTTTDPATALTVIGRLKSLGAQLPALLGRTTMASSLSVAIASDQAAVPVSGTFWQATQPVSQSPQTSGGCSVFRSLSVVAAGQNVKASAGQLYGYYIANTSGATRYVKLYDKATAPVVGTDTPVMTLYLPSGSAANLQPGGLGISFVNGIGVAATNLVADTDTTAPSANDIIVNLWYH